MKRRPSSETLERIYRAAIDAVDAERAVHSCVQLSDDSLVVDNRELRLDSVGRIHLLAVGKAALPMAAAARRVLGARIAGGVVVTKFADAGFDLAWPVMESGHPHPDERGVEAAARVLDYCDHRIEPGDLLFLLISGGGSALLPAPVEGVTLEDKQSITAELIRCGATIQEINAIRKHLSRIKGGRLLEHTSGCRVIALLISDVVGDDLSTIASGPVAPDPTTYRDCLSILHNREIIDRIPRAVKRWFERGESGQAPETLKPGDPRFDTVEHVIVARNLDALEAAADAALESGFSPLILSSRVEMDTSELARLHVAVAAEILASGHPLPAPACVLTGGETTLIVTGSGKGGRNQEYALWCARQARGLPDRVLFAGFGTDGNDGPTEAAGAFSTTRTWEEARAAGLDPGDFLRRNDSFHFFENAGGLIVTGPTHTNVMDLHITLVAD